MTPSQPRPSFSQPVSSSLSACVGMPLIEAELTMTDSAPASMAALNGAKCFSRSSLSDTYAGVRS